MEEAKAASYKASERQGCKENDTTKELTRHFCVGRRTIGFRDHHEEKNDCTEKAASKH